MMMGTPRCLKDLTRAQHIELIAGNTRLGPGDLSPTKRSYRVNHKPVPNGVFRADPTIPPWRYADALAMDVTPDIPLTRHENINYYATAPDAPLAMNEVEVPDSELVDFNNDNAHNLERYKSLFYKTASSLSALNDAAEYVEAALGSGLGIELDMDKALLSAFIPLARLDALVAMVRSTSNLTPEQQDSYIEKITAFLAEKTSHALDRYDLAETHKRGFAVQKELYAKVMSKEQQTAPQGSSTNPATL